ncbi:MULTISPECIES: ROK family transcriptional regulator [Mesotoga]|uniref:ROK family transcriptional regulator n=1 Tax=Mesotoga TaxID=1184396 RepID=UPI0002C8F885|nr:MULTISPECIES: ROK family transcriptional regulator [Mesotoga]CCU84200.1 ROK family protein [Mesotoga infera]RLL83697.1 ROK family protein [Mesotoga sp. H07pep.5.4]HNQ70318.1 ROK family transcriptional regulator [Mesotoga prima]HNS75228.1 ROK family transcriptional regulator [Mesotoga prima]HOP37819.1 ROK family transcriptional regulator [Mesotoga prima]
MVSRLIESRTDEILRIVRGRESTSRVQLAKLTGLSKPTISSIVNALVAEGVITENGLGKSKSSGGRKPINISFAKDYRYVLSIDIGGTKTIFALIDLDGNITNSETIPSDALRTRRGLIDELSERIESYIAQVDRGKVLGISIGIPGTVDRNTQNIKYMPSFDMGNFDLKSHVEECFGIPTLIENDVTLAAFGESWIGSAKEFGDVVLVSIGTGIGSGIVIADSVYRGSSGGAGEIGEFVTDWSIESKMNIGFGRLEQWFSGYALESFCRSNGMKVSVKELFENMESDDRISKRIVSGCEHLALAFANAIMLLDPARLLIGGGIGFNQYDRIFPIINDTLRRVLPEELYRSDLLARASLEPYSVVIGGAYFAQKELLLKEVLGGASGF